MMDAMNGREQILGRIRRALRVPAPKRHVPDPAPTTERFVQALPLIRQEARAWLPPVGETSEERMSMFTAQCADLRAAFFLCADHAEMLRRLTEIAAEEGWRQIASHTGALTDAAVATLSLPSLMTHPGYDMAALEQCDAVLTECDALVAQTGSVLITNRSAGGRAPAALAPHHVVLATRDQLVPDLTAALARLTERCGDEYPSLISFITGPSRTGDIERILVLGAHGPKRLTILCV